MHEHRAVRLHQEEPGGEGQMGFEPANIINGATGYDKTHAVHTTPSALPLRLLVRPAPGRGGPWQGEGPSRGACWGRMEACRVRTVPAVPQQGGRRPEKPAASMARDLSLNSTSRGPAPGWRGVRAHRTATGLSAP